MKPLCLKNDYRISLAELISGYGTVPDIYNDIIIQDLKLDSRMVVAGDLFIAIKGDQYNGSDYIENAIANGARAILIDSNDNIYFPKQCIPLIAIAQLKKNLSAIAGRFFQNPSLNMRIIGVTGTNGKTSCVQYISQALTDCGQQCGSIGTLGFGAINQLCKLDRTTPDAITMQRLLAYFNENNAVAVALEISSHAAVQYRVNGIEFDTLVFTNLSHDHLDYHGDMKNYAAAKKSIFMMPKVRHAVINIDDAFGQQLAIELRNKYKVHTYGLEAIDATISASNIQLKNHNMVANLTSIWGDGEVTSQLLGRFNLSNLLAVSAVLCVGGITIKDTLNAIAKLSSVPGRMQQYSYENLPLIIVDYAHTPDALKSVLETLKEMCTGKLWCLFGCGGDRDQSKRSIMGQVAELLADHLILTNDNPRHENPSHIIEEILSGIKIPETILVIEDRAVAIASCIASAQVDDVILIAGKGHENYQESYGLRIYFSDGEQVIKALNLRMSDESIGSIRTHDR